jgi:hypothetical protein
MEMKRYPDKSHQRRKEREAAEKAAAADRLRNVEEALKRQQDQLDRLNQQGISGQSQRHMVEAAFDGTSALSNKKSSVASTQLQDGDDDALSMAPPKRYPVDDIMESTACDLKVQVMNLRVTGQSAWPYQLRLMQLGIADRFQKGTLSSRWMM